MSTPTASNAAGEVARDPNARRNLVITGPCPHCRGVVDMVGPPFAPGFQCEACEKVFEVEVSEALQAGECPDRCIFCADTDFYIEKDMPRGLGLSLVVMAAVLVPWTQGLSILIVALFQIPFFLLLPMRHVCYGCQALFRRFPTAPHSRPFDHELATMRELAREKAERKAAEAGGAAQGAEAAPDNAAAAG